MSIFKKEYATVDEAGNDQEMNEDQEGDQAMEKVSFFARHKKGLLIGAAAILAGIGGMAALSKKRSCEDEDYEEFDDDDPAVPDEISEES